MRNSRIKRQRKAKKGATNRRATAFVLLLAMLFSLPVWSLGAETGEIPLSLLGKTATSPADDAFTKLDVTAFEVKQNNQIGLTIDMILDTSEEGYLKTKATPIIEEFLASTGGDIDAYLNGLDDATLPTISFECVFSGAQLEIPSGTNSSGVVSTDSGENIGTFLLSINANGDVVFAVDLDKFVYNRDNVTAGKTLDLSVKEAGREGQEPTLGWDDANGYIKLDWGGQQPAEPPSNINYSVDKKGPATVTGTSITYTVEVEASTTDSTITAAGLNGTTFEDEIPAGLAVIAVTMNGVGLPMASSAALTPGYHINNGKLTYDFPEFELDGQPLISKAVFVIEMGLTQDKYKEYIKSGPPKESFKNVARLIKEGKKDPLAVSDEAATTMKTAFFIKDGKAADANNKKYRWTIDANTYFSRSANVYLVDKIEGIDKSHMYATADGIDINGDHKNITVISATTSYDNLNKANIGLLDTLTSGGSLCVQYSYGNTAIMIIPVNDYVNGPIKVEYNTNVISTSVDESRNQTLENNVKIIWEWFAYGNGPAINDDFKIEVSKKTEAKFSLLEKTAGSYDQKTQTMTWNFDVNQFGAEIASIDIYDTFDKTKQVLATDGDFLTIKKSITDGTDWEDAGTLKITNGSGSGNYYELTDDAGNRYLHIHLENIPTDQLWRFSLATKVVDASLLSTQNDKNAGNVANGVTLSAIINGEKVDKDSKANKNLPNVLIEKEAIKRDGVTHGGINSCSECYDYEKHQVGWKIRVNPNNLNILNGVVDDILPMGSSLGDSVTIRRIAADGTVSRTVTSRNPFDAPISVGDVKVEITDAPGTITTKGQVKFAFDKEITDTFEIEFTSVFDSGYRQGAFKSTGANSVTLINQCALSGSVTSGGVSALIQDAKAEASHKITVPPLDKKGKYHDWKKGNEKYVFNDEEGTVAEGMCWVNWTLVVNRDATTMGGMILTDELKDFFELDPLSLKVFPAKMTSAGAFATEAALTIAESGVKAFTTGFALTVPEKYTSTPLVLTYNTFVTDDAKASDMTNNASVSGAVFYSDSTGDKLADGASSFRIGDYATAMTMPYLQIVKISTNSAVGAGGEFLYPLPGAVFTVTAMESAGTGWNETNEKYKVTTTKGNANYLFLKQKTLYKVVEVIPPDGYELLNNEFHFVFGEVSESHAAYPAGTQVFGKDALGNDIKSYTHIVRNMPNDPAESMKNNVTFTKQTEEGQPLAGVTFALKNDRILEKKAVSEASGRVTFINVDEGTYTLSEKGGLSDVFKAPTDALTVTVKQDKGTYTYEITQKNANANPTVTKAGLEYVVANRLARGDMEISKVIENTQTKLSGAAFEVYTSATGLRVAYLADPMNSGVYTLSNRSATGQSDLTAAFKGTQVGKPFTSMYLALDQNGKFKLLAGDYYIMETKAPAGYKGTYENGHPKKYSMTVKDEKTSELSVENISAPYKIRGQKVALGSGAGLPGALLGLFPAGTTGAGFTRDNVICEPVLSGAGGYFAFEGVSKGTYVVGEILPPNGYLKNTEGVPVEVVDADVEADYVIIKNEAAPSPPPTGGGGGGGTVSPPEESTVRPPAVPPGTPPVVPEVQPPVVSEPSVPVVLPSGEVFIPIDPGSVVPGETQFEITGGGISKTIIIDKNGNLNIPPLPAGTYSITNKSTGETIVFTIEDGQVALGGINYDLQSSGPAYQGGTPKTGVETYNGIWLFLLLLSMGGMLAVRRKMR